MDFLFGFLACYAVGAAIELRNVLMFYDETGRDLAPDTAVLTALLWPWFNWLDRKDS